jgi:hypothetical protein
VWIAWVALAITARLIPTVRARRAWSALAPVLAGTVVLLVPEGMTFGPFDPRFFGPASAQDSGIWESDPDVMRSFGPVLAAAGAATMLLSVFLRWNRSSGVEFAEPLEGLER